MNGRPRPSAVRFLSATAVILVIGSLVAGCGSSDSDGTKKTTTTTGNDSIEVVPADAATMSAGEAPAADGGSDAGTSGSKSSDDNIIGGEEIDIAALPWTVALVRPGATNNFCGGTLISPTLVMTAAHCVTELDDAGKEYIVGPTLINAVLGRTSLTAGGGEEIPAKTVLVSDLWDSSTMSGDYAVIELSTASAQTPVALPSQQDNALWQPGVDVIVAGWGCTRSNAVDGGPCEVTGGTSLKAAAEVVLPDATCTTAMAEYGFDPETGLCTGDTTGAGTSCFGDSGGPFITQGEDERWYLISSVSYGAPAPKGDCPADKPETSAWLGPILSPTEPGIDPDSTWSTCDADATQKFCVLATTGG